MEEEGYILNLLLAACGPGEQVEVSWDDEGSPIDLTTWREFAYNYGETLITSPISHAGVLRATYRGFHRLPSFRFAVSLVPTVSQDITATLLYQPSVRTSLQPCRILFDNQTYGVQS